MRRVVNVEREGCKVGILLKKKKVNWSTKYGERVCVEKVTQKRERMRGVVIMRGLELEHTKRGTMFLYSPEYKGTMNQQGTETGEAIA